MTTPLEDAEREVARLREVYPRDPGFAQAMQIHNRTILTLADELDRLRAEEKSNAIAADHDARKLRDQADLLREIGLALEQFDVREPLVQALIIAAGELPSVRGFDAYPEIGDADVSTRVSKLAGVHDAAKAVRDFEVKP